MGMAASQARYLGLTARKTNVEYEGQQINQARTALANQTAELWNKQLELQVPTAPNTTDYTTQQYEFSDGSNDYVIDEMQNVDKTIDGQEYNYLVKYHYNSTKYEGIEQVNSNPQVQKNTSTEVNKGTETGVTATKDDEKTYTVSQGTEQAKFEQCTEKDLDDLKELAAKGIIDIDNIENVYKSEDPDTKEKVYATKEDLDKVANNESNDLTGYSVNETTTSYKIGNSQAQKYDSTSAEQETALEQIMHDFPEGITEEDVKNGDVWVYSKDGKTCYTTTANLEKCIESGKQNQVQDKYQISSPIDYQTGLTQYYATTLEKEVTEEKYARLDDASGTGRYQSIKLSDMSATFDLKSGSTTDETAYENAMQQYNYDIQKYEKTLADINAKTSKIQVEDRTLELRLRQLDTEQKALSTEMEAVKSVIQKNIESTFKTFSS